MEIKKKSTSLAGLFTGSTVMFCVNTVLIVLLLVVLSLAAVVFLQGRGILLPANYAELYLNRGAESIRTADVVDEAMLPPGCSFGVYEADGTYLYGSLTGEEQFTAWNAYKENNGTGGGGSYYRFIEKEDHQLCIIKYILKMQFANEKLNEALPNVELLMLVMVFLLFLVLLIGNGIMVSRKFARLLQQRLCKLQDVTGKISENDLDFEPEYSDIREINEVMESLFRMKTALQESLQKQWRMENQKKEQLAALAHDIKTPLTIIKGNAQLLTEESLSESEKECTGYILQNVEQIEQYLQSIRQILQDGTDPESWEQLTAAEWSDALKQVAIQLAAAQKIPVSLVMKATEPFASCEKTSESSCICEQEPKSPSSGEKEPQEIISCDRELLLRSWGNILSNALEYTDPEQGIQVIFQETQIEQQKFRTASVRDFGPGFSKKELLYADQKFYSGEESRHNRTHQGLGLAIAKEFAEAQGGFLKLDNAEEGTGAVVTISLLTTHRNTE